MLENDDLPKETHQTPPQIFCNHIFSRKDLSLCNYPNELCSAIVLPKIISIFNLINWISIQSSHALSWKTHSYDSLRNI